MNIKTISNNPKLKYFYYLGIILPFIVILALAPKNKLNAPSTSTTPLISDNKNKENNIQPTEYINVLNPNQKNNVEWNNLEFNLPKTANSYKINTPIINESTIVSLANKLNFQASDKLTDVDKGTNYWINNSSSLFASTKQNEITYFLTTQIPPHSQEIEEIEAVQIARQIIIELFNQEFFDSLDSPIVKYFNHQPKKIETEPVLVDKKSNNIIQIAFNQKILSSQIFNSSKTGEILYLTIDTTKKLHSLNIYGGYQNIEQNKTENIMNYEELKESFQKNATRLTNAKDIGSEKGLSTAEEIKINLKSIKLGYFEFNSIYSPVFILEGTVSTKNNPIFPAIYMVPAVKNI
jgi:hypothetical protein